MRDKASGDLYVVAKGAYVILREKKKGRTVLLSSERERIAVFESCVRPHAVVAFAIRFIINAPFTSLVPPKED